MSKNDESSVWERLKFRQTEDKLVDEPRSTVYAYMLTKTGIGSFGINCREENGGRIEAEQPLNNCRKLFVLERDIS